MHSTYIHIHSEVKVAWLDFTKFHEERNQINQYKYRLSPTTAHWWLLHPSTRQKEARKALQDALISVNNGNHGNAYWAMIYFETLVGSGEWNEYRQLYSYIYAKIYQLKNKPQLTFIHAVQGTSHKNQETRDEDLDNKLNELLDYAESAIKVSADQVKKLKKELRNKAQRFSKTKLKKPNKNKSKNTCRSRRRKKKSQKAKKRRFKKRNHKK